MNDLHQFEGAMLGKLEVDSFSVGVVNFYGVWSLVDIIIVAERSQ